MYRFYIGPFGSPINSLFSASEAVAIKAVLYMATEAHFFM